MAKIKKGDLVQVISGAKPERGGDRRLARAHRADEHHDGSGHRHLNLNVSR